MHRILAAAVVIAGLALSTPAAGQPAPKTTRAVRLTGAAPRIDGAMEEAVWATAVPIADFVAKLPIAFGMAGSSGAG